MSGRLEGSHVLVTGGAGFIGSHLVDLLLDCYDDVRVTTLDALTYAGDLANLAAARRDERHDFIHGDVCDAEVVRELVDQVDFVFHLAAETHVDRSIEAGERFARTDMVGTAVLLDAIRHATVARFLHVSTDEVYGEILGQPADEEHPLRPRNPYSAAKAGADMLVAAYRTTHGVPAIVVRPSNHFGPRQHAEKFIPVCIAAALQGHDLPLYGDGRQRREWTYVSDGAAAIVHVMETGEPGDVYNIGTGDERENLHVAQSICDAIGADRALIQSVPDRPGHDRRYSLDTTKLDRLGWAPRVDFETGLEKTVAWYRDRRSRS